MHGPGSSAASELTRAWRRPWAAVAIAAAGLAVTAAVVLLIPSAHIAMARWPGAVVALADLLLLSAPLLAAVIVAARVSGDRLAAATGLGRFLWTDLLAGAGVGLAARALVELVAPTAGGLGGGLDAATSDTGAAIVVTMAGAVLLTPYTEELFFRGLLQRALGDALARAGRIVAGAVAVLVATGAFVALHALAAGAAMPLGLLLGTAAIGVGCGTLTLVTGRLGGAVVAHVLYNAIGVALLVW